MSKSDLNTTTMHIYGVDTSIYGMQYGQYNLNPGEYHIGCENESCIDITLPDNGVSVFSHWSIYILLIVMCLVSYFVPVTAIPALVYGYWLINMYLPSKHASFEEMLLTAILVICGIMIGGFGWKRTAY